MKATQQLHDLGQGLWLDNITRGLLTSGTLRHYINHRSVGECQANYPPMGAMPKRCSLSSRGQRWMIRRSPPNFSARAPSRSTNPGTS